MKTIFTVTSEHDGLQNACFTNIKALYNFIVNELNVNDGTLNYNDNTRIVFNYSNFVKGIRLAQSKNRFFVSYIDSDINSITVNELGIISN